MRTLRVLYVSTHYGEKEGGGGIAAEDLSHSIRNKGCTVTNLSLGSPSKLMCRLKPYLLFFRFVDNVSRHDIVFSHFHTFTHTTIVSYVCARLFKKPIIVRIDDYFYTTRFRWFRIFEMALQNAILKRCDRVFTVSEDYRKRIPLSNVGIIRNGVNFAIFNPALYETEASVKKHSVIFLGVAYEHRAINKLVKVAKELPNIDFLLVGESEFRDLPPNVKALWVPHKEVPKMLATSKVAICSLETNMLNVGSSPVKVAEYIAFDLPIISWKGSLDSSIPYIWVSNEQELKEAIKLFIDKDFKYDSNFVKQYNWDVIAEEVMKILEQLFEEKK